MTLVELLASIAIFSILFGIIMSHHARFGGAVLLNNLAYDIALSLRQAQVYGLSVKEFETGSGQFHTGYGIHFARTSPTTYILFADRDPAGPGLPNNRYDAVPACGVVGSECIESFTLGRGNRIADACGILPGGAEECFSDAGLSPRVNFLDIIFVRPDPDALLVSNRGSAYASVRVTVVSPEGITQDIFTRITGQISVGN